MEDGEGREKVEMEEEEKEKEEKKGRCNENAGKETENAYTIRGHTISTEINQGCAQISKRKITKINRPDVRRDKKRDSRFPPLFFLRLPLHTPRRAE